MQIVRIGDGSTGDVSADVIGAKAFNLARMAALGLPVPPAFVLPVDLCAAVIDGDRKAKQWLSDGLAEGMAFLESATGRDFGDRRNPLLVSVRSGAARSMPGMLDTVLDVGCNGDAVRGLIRTSGNPRFAWDCRLRFLESYGSVVLGLNHQLFNAQRGAILASERVTDTCLLDCEALEVLAGRYANVIENEGHACPDAPMEQLREAANAVYRSWMSDRACTYRRLQQLDDLHGTAVTVQAMVFGNRSRRSGSGVAFSRDPSTGQGRPVIDILFEAQGEDVVSGKRNPENEEAIARSASVAGSQLREILIRLERAFADVQDVEFTIEDETLWMLQTRSAKRTPQAALRLAVDFVREGLIAPSEALRRLKDVDLDKCTSKRLVGVDQAVARGTGASSGVAVGRAAFNAASAEHLAARGEPVILLRPDTSTSDIAGFSASEGVITAIGGRTAHAALVMRQLGKPCVVACASLVIDAASGMAQIGSRKLAEGDWISLDADCGAVYLGQGQIVVERPERELAEITRWRAAEESQTSVPMPAA